MKTPAIVRFGIALSASWRNRTALLGTFWKPLGPSWGSLGALLGRSWGSLGALLAALEAPWGHLGGHRSKERRAFFPPPPVEALI